MSEKKTQKTEVSIHHGEHLKGHEHHGVSEKHHEKISHHTPEKHQKRIEDIRKTVEESAIESELLKNEESKTAEQDSAQVFVQKELKKITFKKTLSKVQKELPPADRMFSKVVHAPIVDKMSAAGERTVARPIGILGGGTFALLGSLFSTYFSRRFGMSYNIFMFVIFFVIGYIASTLVELLYRSLTKARNN